MKYYIYMLRCEDNSLYTGITTDLPRRFCEHTARHGAKYTSVHRAAAIAAAWETDGGRSEASKLEYFIKQLPKREKERLVENPRLLSPLSGRSAQPIDNFNAAVRQNGEYNDEKK